MRSEESPPKGRVVLLGAGATRGANFGYPQVCQPPLNRDFFTQLQRITEKDTVLVRQVVADIVELFGSNFTLTLEDYFTQLEFLLSTASGPGRSSGQLDLGNALRDKRNRLMAALAAVLEASTNPAIFGRTARGCQYHRLIAKQLAPGDTVISFNYDCVIDDALRREGSGQWSARWGYGFPRGFAVDNWDYWTPSPDTVASSNDTIRLLKLHGSVHFQIQSNAVRLKERLHRQRGTPRFDIIPPQWNKSLNTPVFGHLWTQAFRAIQQSDRIAVIGFSFTPTDLHVESLVRLALTDSELKTVVIANPSADDRQRIRRVMSSALARGAPVVREYETLADVAAVWPDCLDH